MLKNNLIKKSVCFLLIVLCIENMTLSVQASLQEEKIQIEKELSSYENKLKESLNKLSETTEKIQEKEIQLSETNTKLEELEIKKNEQYEYIKKAIQIIYENGSYVLLENILESKSFAEINNHIEYTNMFYKYQNEKLNEYLEQLEKIQELKMTIEAEKNELIKLKETQESTKKELETMISNKKSDLNELNEQIQQELNTTRYSNVSFSKSGNAYSYGNNELDLICAIVAQESNTSYEGALAVITCALNRAESSKWNYLGGDPLSQLKAPGQFCYSIDNHWRKRLNGNYPDYVKQAVLDGLNGSRNHNYLSFRGYQTSGSVQIGGNWYFSPM